MRCYEVDDMLIKAFLCTVHKVCRLKQVYLFIAKQRRKGIPVYVGTLYFGNNLASLMANNTLKI